MPVSRGRKRKSRKREPNQTQTPSRIPLQPPKTRWEKIRDHPIPWMFGLVAALLAIGGFVQQVLLAPEISAESNPDLSSPFALPFKVHNNSFLFVMRNAQLYCGIDKVIFQNRSGLEALSLISSKAPIEPGMDAEFRCQINGKNAIVRFAKSDLAEGHIFLSVRYTTLGIFRKSPETEFTWYTDANPPRWIRGKIVR